MADHPASSPTIGDLVASHLPVTACCSGSYCRHSERLNPLHLAEGLGAQFPLARLAERLRCGLCGAPAEVRVERREAA